MIPLNGSIRSPQIADDVSLFPRLAFHLHVHSAETAAMSLLTL